MALSNGTMVVKIKPAAPGMSGTLAYNQNKVLAGVAEVLCRMNMDSEGDNAVRDTFARYERLNICSREVCFHMSVNPGEDEKMDDSKALSLVEEIMKELGYQGQPYVVYRHNDIEREHFHVVSTRIRENGRKISSFQEQNRCRKFLDGASEKYGFTLGSNSSRRLIEKGLNPRLFEIGRGEISRQMDAVFEECLKYHFTSESQFRQILLDHNLAITGTTSMVRLQGLDSNGYKCTPPVAKADLMSMMTDRMQECLSADRSRAAHRVAQIGSTLLPVSTSESHFINLMLKREIHVMMERRSSGRIGSIMYIDHQARCAFNSDELGHDLSLVKVQDADVQKWQHDEDSGKRINVGEFLFGHGSNSKGHEKDPKYKKKKKGNIHL